MTKSNSHEFSNLRKSISLYIDKYPAPDKNLNNSRLQKLAELKPYINSDSKKNKEYHKLREIITLSNGGFAMKYVMRYFNLLNDDNAIGELFQEATIGIMESIDTFDIKKKTSFTTYAHFHIKKRIIDFIKHNKLIRAPRDIARNMRHVNDVQDFLSTNNGYDPTTKEIKIELKKQKGIKLKVETIDSIVLLLELNSGSNSFAFLSEFTDQVYEEETSELFRLMELNILNNISKYTDKMQNIIKFRYGIGREHPHSIEELKLILNISDKELKEIDI